LAQRWSGSYTDADPNSYADAGSNCDSNPGTGTWKDHYQEAHTKFDIVDDRVSLCGHEHFNPDFYLGQ
jgi:hypothetical protein